MVAGLGEQEHACVLQGNSCLRVNRKEVDVYLFGLVLLHMFFFSRAALLLG